MNIPVLLGATRPGRKSDRVARYLRRKLDARAITGPLIDLRDYDIPHYTASARALDPLPDGIARLGEALQMADGLLIVTPEYNGSYPGVLKDALDLFGKGEFGRKPVAIATTSSGDFGGTNVLQLLRLYMSRVGALPVPTQFTVQRVQDAFTEEGTPTGEQTEKFADGLLDDLVWLTEATMARKAAP